MDSLARCDVDDGEDELGALVYQFSKTAKALKAGIAIRPRRSDNDVDEGAASDGLTSESDRPDLQVKSSDVNVNGIDEQEQQLKGAFGACQPTLCLSMYDPRSTPRAVLIEQKAQQPQPQPSLVGSDDRLIVHQSSHERERSPTAQLPNPADMSKEVQLKLLGRIQQWREEYQKEYEQPTPATTQRRQAGRECSAEGCTDIAQKGGVCRRHFSPENQVSAEGCTNQIVHKGVCVRHGAQRNQKQDNHEPTCSAMGCTNYPHLTGFCIEHELEIIEAAGFDKKEHCLSINMPIKRRDFPQPEINEWESSPCMSSHDDTSSTRLERLNDDKDILLRAMHSIKECQKNPTLSDHQPLSVPRFSPITASGLTRASPPTFDENTVTPPPPPSTTSKKKRIRNRELRVLDKDRVAVPTDDDVLFGRGKGMNNHPGNIKFRNAAIGYWPRYKISSNHEKGRITRELVQSVKDEGNRFLEKDESGLWREVLKGEHSKASQTFRDNTNMVKASGECYNPTMTSIKTMPSVNPANPTESMQNGSNECPIVFRPLPPQSQLSIIDVVSRNKEEHCLSSNMPNKKKDYSQPEIKEWESSPGMSNYDDALIGLVMLNDGKDTLSRPMHSNEESQKNPTFSVHQPLSVPPLPEPMIMRGLPHASPPTLNEKTPTPPPPLPSATSKKKRKRIRRREPRVLDKDRVAVPTDNDVIFGRGKGPNKHPGNVKFRNAALACWPSYKDSSNDIKNGIMKALAQSVKDGGNRFLEKDKSGVWREVLKGEESKASQTFRDLPKNLRTDQILLAKRHGFNSGHVHEGDVTLS